MAAESDSARRKFFVRETKADAAGEMSCVAGLCASASLPGSAARVLFELLRM
jgi:hypothetical protein